MKQFLLILLPLIYIPLLQAEVITDGTLGARVELPGKNFDITPDLGKQLGQNLFHSFDRFSLQAGESATFSGPSQIQNIIARVTGGNPSTIDGTLRSTIPEAELYLINPYGILFGKNAKLDLQGGFHATTADELRFADGTTFNARTPQSAHLLSVAPIQSFGFLSDTPAAIQLQHSRLQVLDGHTISLIGGELHLQGEVLKDEQGEPVINGEITFLKFPTYAYTTELKTPAGRINLASVASRGEVSLSNNDLRITANQLGDITLNHAEAKTSGFGSGSIFIRGADLTLQNGKISNITEGEQDGGVVDIQVNHFLVAGSLTTAGVIAETKGAGRGSEIRVTANNLELRGGSINTSVYDRGHGGNITVHIADKIKLSNPTPELLKFAGIYSDTYGMQEDAGNGGNLQIEAGQIEIHAVSSIAAASYGKGNTGNTQIKTHGDILVTGTALINGWSHNASISNSSYLGSAFTKAFGREGKGGNAGHVTIEANKLTLSELGLVLSDAYSGDAGQIDIHAQDIDILSGGNIGCSTFGEGKGGALSITTQRLNISENLATRKYPSGIYSDSLSDAENAGIAGDIVVHANTVNVFEHSAISSSTQNAMGGNIYLSATNLLYLQNGKVTTSVSGGIGNGGDISILNTPLIVSNNGKIVAQADAGHGGNIRLVTQHLIPSSRSLISASSRLGIDGNVFISSPVRDLSGQLVDLSSDFVDGASLLPRSCAARVADQRPSEFVRPFRLRVNPPNAKPSPDDLRPSNTLVSRSK